MAAIKERKLSSDFQEERQLLDEAQTVDLSFIHWGYLNSTLVTDQSKKTKDLIWKTYWVDLCGSTLRLYRDLGLSPDSGNFPPPSKIVGPTGEDEKKEAFLVLKKGASICIPKSDEFRPKRKIKNRAELPLRNNVFKLQVLNSNNSPVYFFEAPSKGSMYRWISKLEEGIDIADNPQNLSVSDKKLKEAKLLALESRRYQNVAPELKYSDNKDDTDSGMEGDVEESIEFQEKRPPDPRLEKLLEVLHHKEDLLEMLEKGEKAFLGVNGQLVKVKKFIATTKADYYLVPGYKSTLIPKGTQINVLGQLSNQRWRCYVDLPKTSTNVNSSHTPDRNTAGIENPSAACSERLLGSVPTSLLHELDDIEPSPTLPKTDLSILPLGTPDVTPNVSPHPSPPPSPYSPHKPNASNQGEESEGFQRRSPTNLQRFVPSMDLSDVDAWEQFVIPSPPSTPVTSRSTTPSMSPSESLEGLDDAVDVAADRERTSSSLSNDIPVTYIGSLPDSEPTLDTSGSSSVPVELRNKGPDCTKQPDEAKNYSFLVTKKLRQRGISLIVGSSSSEDEDDFDESLEGPYKGKISRRKLDEELERCAAQHDDPAAVRPYSAFVPRKSKTLNFGTKPKNVKLRTATTDDLLKDYSSNNLARSKTCMTLSSVMGGPSQPENAPPVNQRRTIQLKRAEREGFGFTLQTYGIVQQNGEVEYMTFVLTVEDDGPAYMAGMRPGDIIVSIENKNVEDADHKTIVSLLQSSPASVRMVVVFVDAIRRMHLNTQIKVLRTELHNKEDAFKHLCKREREILTRSGDPGALAGLDLDVFGATRSDSDSYLYTTELTSSFSKDSHKVKDSLVKYRQHVDDKPRPFSLPDRNELTKQRLILSTGTELLKSFASSAESVLKKTASVKLKKKVQKTKQVSKTFKSYLEQDEQGGEGPLSTSSPKHIPSNKVPSEPPSSPSRLSWPSKRNTDLSQDNKTLTSGDMSPLPSCKSLPAKMDKSINESEQCTAMSKPDAISIPVDAKMFPRQGQVETTLAENITDDRQELLTPINMSRDENTVSRDRPSTIGSDDNLSPVRFPCDKRNPDAVSHVKTAPEDISRDEASRANLPHSYSSARDLSRNITSSQVSSHNVRSPGTSPLDVSLSGNTSRDQTSLGSVSPAMTSPEPSSHDMNSRDISTPTCTSRGASSRDMTSSGNSTSQTSSLVIKCDVNDTSRVDGKTVPHETAATKDAEKKILEILRQTKNIDTKVKRYGNNVHHDKSDETERETVLKKCMKTAEAGCSGVDRCRTNNIASLRKLFEGQDGGSSNTKEESDVFASGHCKVAPKRTEFPPRARLGSRPMSYMRAMDSAADSPLIPDDEANDDDSTFESSA